MSLANRKKFYKIFMDQGMTEKAEDLVKNHPECIPTEEEEKPVEKKKKRKK